MTDNNDRTRRFDKLSIKKTVTNDKSQTFKECFVYIGDSGPSISLEDGPVVSVILGHYFFTFLKDSPDKLRRCAPCTRRSNTLSANVPSSMTSHHVLTGN